MDRIDPVWWAIPVHRSNSSQIVAESEYTPPPATDLFISCFRFYIFFYTFFYIFFYIFYVEKKVSFCGFPKFYQDDLENGLSACRQARPKKFWTMVCFLTNFQGPTRHFLIDFWWFKTTPTSFLTKFTAQILKNVEFRHLFRIHIFFIDFFTKRKM